MLIKMNQVVVIIAFLCEFSSYVKRERILFEELYHNKF